MSVLTRVVPEWIRHYKISWLSVDVLAGVTLAAVAVPEVMGYTSIAQTPVITGLYTIIFPTLVFALLGSSRLLVVGAFRHRRDPGGGPCRARHLGPVAELVGVGGMDEPRGARLRRDADPRTAAPARIPG